MYLFSIEINEICWIFLSGSIKKLNQHSVFLMLNILFFTYFNNPPIFSKTLLSVNRKKNWLKQLSRWTHKATCPRAADFCSCFLKGNNVKTEFVMFVQISVYLVRSPSLSDSHCIYIACRQTSINTDLLKEMNWAFISNTTDTKLFSWTEILWWFIIWC